MTRRLLAAVVVAAGLAVPAAPASAEDCDPANVRCFVAYYCDDCVYVPPVGPLPLTFCIGTGRIQVCSPWDATGQP